jgi:hypothetical protein
MDRLLYHLLREIKFGALLERLPQHPGTYQNAWFATGKYLPFAVDYFQHLMTRFQDTTHLNHGRILLIVLVPNLFDQSIITKTKRISCLQYPKRAFDVPSFLLDI